jgi:hypothetical protein
VLDIWLVYSNGQAQQPIPAVLPLPPSLMQ